MTTILYRLGKGSKYFFRGGGQILFADREFVTSGTCVKYFWVKVNFSRIIKITLSVRFAEFRLEFLQNNLSEFVLPVDNCIKD